MLGGMQGVTLSPLFSHLSLPKATREDNTLGNSTMGAVGVDYVSRITRRVVRLTRGIIESCYRDQLLQLARTTHTRHAYWREVAK